jgi:hypothetical protein
MPTDEPESPTERRVAWLLRLFGAVDCLALLAVVMPRTAMNAIAAASGLDGLPEGPLPEYLARSASLMYALHGATVLFIARDVRRYWPLIRFLASLAVVHGLIVFAIDSRIGMPLWWRIVEGPAFTITGLSVLLAQGLRTAR